MYSFMYVMEIIVIFFWAYWFVISLFGFGKPKKLPEMVPKSKFIILVPAHNEAAVIRPTIESIMSLDYPRTLYDVLLIADNCDDDTAEIGRECGVIVIEHSYLPGEPKGKPHAIKYALEWLGDRLTTDYDAILMVDADNLLSNNFLKEMNNHLLNGERLIQCYLDSKNPNDRWVSLAYATSYYYMNRAWQLAKSRIGLGNAIGGTGFCVETKLFEEVGWNAKSLTEDLEFTMQCLLKGVPATWAHYAKIYDEKPIKFWASMKQRLRWSQGHWDVCMRYTFPLLWRAITKLDIRALDGALYLVNQGRVVVGEFTSAVLYFSVFFLFNVPYIIPTWLWLSLIGFSWLYIIYGIMKDSEHRVNPIKAFLSMWLLNYSYIPLFVIGLFTLGNKNWTHTKHTRAISSQNLKK